jgi:transposase InsO family protein
MEHRLINSSTQTDDIQVSMVTTRSVTRNRRCLLDPTDASLPPTPSAATATTPCSSQARHLSPPSSFDVSQTFFDDATLNTHQNQDNAIHSIKTTQPLSSTFALGDLGVLYKIVARGHNSSLSLRYIPRSLVHKVLFAYHNSTYSGAHYGIKRAFYKLRDRFYWPRMYSDIVQHVQSCVKCRQNKPSRRKLDGHLNPITPPRGTWERLAMDYVGPVPTSEAGNKYIIVLTDLFSKFVVTKVVPDNTSTTAAKFLLYDVFMIYGVPFEIITDNGRHFTSSLYESLVKLTGCSYVKTTPYNPQANGQCERHNATLVPNLLSLSLTSLVPTGITN